MPKLPQHIEKLFDEKFVRKFVSTQSDASVEDWKFLDNPPMVGSYVGPKEIKSFIATILDEEREEIIQKIKSLKCTEHKIHFFGRYEASSYNEKTLANAVLDEVIINIIKKDEKTTKDNL